MNRSLFAAIAALLLVGIGLWWWGTATPAAPAGPGAGVVEDTTTSIPPAEPEPTPSPGAEPSLAQAPAVPEAPAAPAAPAAPVREPDPEPPMTTDEAYALGSLPRLKHAFETDPVDAQASTVERDIRGLFGSEQIPLDTLLGVQCRERVCRLELRWTPDRPHTFMAAGQAVGKLVSRNSAVESLAGPDTKGERRMAVYVGRREYRAQDLEEPAGEEQ